MKTFKPKTVLWHLFTKKRLKHGDEINLKSQLIPVASIDGVSCFNLNQDAKLYEVFLNKFIEEKKVATLRTLDYLRWRYFDIPIRKYHAYKSVENGKMNGLIILRTREIYGLKTCVFMEFIATNELKSAKHLLSQIFDLLKKMTSRSLLLPCRVHTKSSHFSKRQDFTKYLNDFFPSNLT